MTEPVIISPSPSPPPLIIEQPQQFSNKREMSSGGGQQSTMTTNTCSSTAMASTTGTNTSSASNPPTTTERDHHPPAGGNNSGGGGSGAPPMREYCLRWNNHQPNLVNFFGTLLQRESFVDVTLVSSEGKQLHAHKLVLSACSPYFQSVFESNPCKHPIVILKDIHFADLRTIVNFVYNGEVNISQDKINSILATASTLQIKGLAEVPADELKRVGGPRGTIDSSLLRSHPPPLQSSSSWGSAEVEDFRQGETPRKKLKKSTSAAGAGGQPSLSTNGEKNSLGSFESGVGASMSRSMDDGAMESGVRSPASRPGPPPLTAGSQLSQHHKSRSLDTGIVEREGPNADSELSSGGYSENQTYDDSSLGADRGFELEIADVKIEAVSDDGEIEYDEEFENPDNPDFELNQTYPNYQSSSFQSNRHLNPSVAGGGKGRRGRLLIRQPRVKRSDGDVGRIGADGNLMEETSVGSDEVVTTVLIGGSSPSDTQAPKVDIISGDESFSFSSSLSRQQSIVPIVTVSESSPTPPSSPSPQMMTKEVSTAMRHTAFSSGGVSSSRLLMIPSSSEPEIYKGFASTGTLVKQLSQPHLPSQTHLSGSTTSYLPRQHSQPNSSSVPTTTRLVYSGVKPGDLFQIVPSEGFQGNRDDHERSFLVDSSSILQIIPAVEGSTGAGRVTFATKGSLKDMEIIRRDLKRELSEGGSTESNFQAPDDSSRDNMALSIDEGNLPKVPQRSGHCPALRVGPSLGCNYCWNSVDKCGRILRRKTKYHCPECHINLCIVPCFQEYHEKADKKKVKGSKLLLPKPSSM